MSNPDKLTIPERVLTSVRSDVNDTLGKKDARNWNCGVIRSIFNQHVGALVCRYCGHLNVPDATYCANCGLSHEISLFVGVVQPEPKVIDVEVIDQMPIIDVVLEEKPK